MSDRQDSTPLRRIMMVDDSRLMRRAVSKILAKLYDVVEAADGEEAWKRLQEDETIELVCCDLSMPVLDGFGFLARVHGADDERVRTTPVIIVTGAEDTEENRNAIFDQGAVDFVGKPFDSVQLKARIKAHLGQIETVRELEERAATDPVTGLGTREFFLKAGQQKISHASREGYGLAIVQFTIDNFHDLFMRVGRSGAGMVLKKVGEIISTQARQEDILSRVGLDSFTALLHTDDPEGALRMASRVLDAVSNVTVTFKDWKHGLSVSVGLMQVEASEAARIEDLLQSARNLALDAQKAGGNCIQAGPRAVASKEAPAAQARPLTVEDALDLLRRGDDDQVREQLEPLILRILPLLELYGKTGKPGVKDAILALRRSIS
ncbi:MAG: response regulator [Chromatiales bacterium]|jgi:diguanylate cyclase (GGDEF)-like protein